MQRPLATARREHWDATGLIWGLLGAIIIGISAIESQFAPAKLFSEAGLKNAYEIISGMASPDFSASFISRVLGLMAQSFAIGFMGLGLALLCGVPLALVAARLPHLVDAPKARSLGDFLLEGLRPVARFVLSVLRSIPEIIWAFLFVRILGLGPGPAILAIGLSFCGIIGKLFAELMESCPPEAGRTLRGAGASRFGVALYGVLPQIRHQWVGYGLFRLECAIRSASVLGVVGAGGIGSEIDLSIRYFQYDKLATSLLAVLGAVICLEAISWLLRRRHLGWSLGFVSLGGVAGFLGSDIRWGNLFSNQAWTQLVLFGSEFSNPLLEWNWLKGALGAMGETLCMALFATMLAALIAFVVAPWAAKRIAVVSYLDELSTHDGIIGKLYWALWLGARFTLQVSRAIPELVWALIFVVWVGAGPMAGTLAIAAHTIGVLGRLYGEVYDDIELDAPHSMEVCGAGRGGVWAYGVLPQALRPMLAYTLFRLEVNVRATAMVGFVGAGGIGNAIHTAISLFHFQELATLLMVLVVAVSCVDLSSSAIRHRVVVR